MLKIDRYSLQQLIRESKITNTAIITYLAAVHMSRDFSYVVIENFSIYKLYKYMQDELKMDWIQKSSVYNSCKLLMELGYLTIEETQNGKLADLPGMASGFYSKGEDNPNGKGYIKLHTIFFTKTFYELELRDKKVLINFLLILNNDKDPKPYNIVNKKDELFKMCKINRFAHILGILKRLSKIMGIRLLKYFTYHIFLKGEVLKVFKSNKSQVTISEKDKNYIKNLLDKLQQKYTEADLHYLALGLHGHKDSIKRQTIIEYMLAKVKNVIRHPVSYIDTIAKRITAEQM
jgi:hypothetical protein